MKTISRIRTRLGTALGRGGTAAHGQGRHPDPLTAPPPGALTWDETRRHAFHSPQMTWFRDSLRVQGSDVRAGVLDDLSTYTGYTPAECVQRCINWEQWSVREWQAADRTTEAGLQDFYQNTQSWAFDLLWYAYLQTEGYGYPSSVAALRAAGPASPPDGYQATHLDFGSGVGVTTQLFTRAGYDCTLADISASLLDFAQYRLGRRGEKARYIHLGLAEQPLPAGEYDVITALDTLAHMPDLTRGVASLRDALRPGGTLITNFDARKAAPENAWHLYADDRRFRAALAGAGFAEHARFGGYASYRLHR